MQEYRKQEKPNIILIHSFPTNTIIIKGLLEYLEEFHNVYPIDLPGFVPESEPIPKVTIENYAKAAQKQIDALGIDNYWMAGLSFGFLVANLCSLDKRCFGTVGIVPYINKNYLIKNELLYFFLEKSFDMIRRFKWHEKAYRSSWLKKALLRETHTERINEVLSTVSAYTFFETALLLLKYDEEPVFHHKPYIFFLTEEDSTIRMEELAILLNSIKNKRVVRTTCDHHPDEITKQYFEANVNPQDHKAIVKFMLDYQYQTRFADNQDLDYRKRI